MQINSQIRMRASAHINGDRTQSPARRRINSREAAKYTGLSYSKLTKLRCTGGGPKYFKLEKRVIYDIADLDTWMNERVRQNTSQY